MADNTDKLAEIASSLKKRTEREEAILAQPDLMDIICDAVASGGSVLELVQTYDIRYTKIMRFIHGNPDHQKLYDQALKDREEWFIETLMRELRSIGLVDIRKLYDEKGALLPPNKWPDSEARAVSQIETCEKQGAHGYVEGTITKVKLHDKIKALHLHGKDLGKFLDRIEHSGTIKLDELIGGSFATDKK